MKLKIKYFIVASSLPATLWPIVGLALSNARIGGNLDFMPVSLTIPLLFGFFNLLSSFIKFERNKKNMLFTGLFLGLLMSIIGSSYNIPERIYGLTGNMSYLAFIGGPIFYGAIWRFVVHPLENAI